MPEPVDGNKQLLWKYAGMAFQFLCMIGLAVWSGWYFDKKISLKFPLLIWLLPLIVIIALITKAVADTAKEKHKKN